VDELMYFDMRHIDPSFVSKANSCPVKGCTTTLHKVPYRKWLMDYCPIHKIRIHRASRTFVYYNDDDVASKTTAPLRNILFEKDYFHSSFLGNPDKAETTRFCNETSEDALTWNVFTSLAQAGKLLNVAFQLAPFTNVDREPELYLWGLRVDVKQRTKPDLFQPLSDARNHFEKDIRRYRTEPDIMLYIPGKLLVLIEAKFTSPNTVSDDVSRHSDKAGEKPKSRSGIIERYKLSKVYGNPLMPEKSGNMFFSQLYRNLIFAIYMSKQLNVDWAFVNLVCDQQCSLNQSNEKFSDPTHFIHSILREDLRNHFMRYSWEQLFRDFVHNASQLTTLDEYLLNKSANLRPAFSCGG